LGLAGKTILATHGGSLPTREAHAWVPLTPPAAQQIGTFVAGLCPTEGVLSGAASPLSGQQDEDDGV